MTKNEELFDQVIKTLLTQSGIEDQLSREAPLWLVKTFLEIQRARTSERLALKTVLSLAVQDQHPASTRYAIRALQDLDAREGLPIQDYGVA
jgi:hypothetical protein